MKNFRWQGLIFFLFVFILSIGLSYLAFKESSQEPDDKEQKMSIALVNEDEGTIFNDEEITFGNEFANSVNKDSKHDWYVVSRGVAESGYKRNAYDMVIIIPNDFSEKSLSIHLERPEPVTLHYKINASGHENVRAEAEKTAGKILNDFNTKLIDVYFASIIENLQEAQDNVSKIINKEKEYTNQYNNQINLPLTNYTSQFKTVQDYTKVSKDSYRGLESVLDMFKSNLQEDVSNHKTYSSEVDSVIRVKEDNSKLTNTFSKVFDQFTQQMHRGELLQQLAQLERENEFVHREFQESEEYETLTSKANGLDRLLKRMVERIEALEDNIQEKFGPELEETIKGEIETYFDEENVRIVSVLLDEIDGNVLEELKAQINELPTLDKDGVIHSGLSEETVNDLVNVIKVTKRFNKEFNHQAKEGDSSKLISEKIKKIKQSLVDSGVTVTDEMNHLPEYGEDGEQIFYLEIPKHFTLNSLKINGEERTYDKDGIKLINVSSEKLTVEANLKLKDVEADIDVTSPITWSWKVFQEGMEVEVENDPNDETNHEEQPDESDKGDDESTKGDTEEENVEEEPPTDELEDNNGENATDEEKDNEEPPTSGEDTDNDNNSISEDSQTIIRTNNYLYQKVDSSLISKPTEKFMEATAEMVSEYYKLHSLYELYFGFDIRELELGEESLADLATEDSLYYFIHNKEIKEILTENIAKEVMKIVTKNLQKSLTIIEEQMERHAQFVNITRENSKSLVGKMAETSSHANQLNKDVKSVLTELAKWRENSSELVKEQMVILNSDLEVQTAIMNLDTGYQPLLMSSESLAEQAKANFDTADQVYQTFESIDEQAGMIQDSGVNLVAQANELAKKLTEKATNDANFSENFNEVLANSRVGDRPNESLYRFLANPVQTKNEGVISKGESFTAYFLVIILSIVTLFTAYVISNITERRNSESVNEEEESLIRKNTGVATITASIGLIEGIIIGLMSFYLLDFDQGEIYGWLGINILLTMCMLFMATYLLRQLKMVGMFILLSILSLYLLLTNSLGFKFENSSMVESLRNVSPLQYAENVLSFMIDGKGNNILFIIMILGVMTIAGLLLNLVVVKKEREKEMKDENTAEAN